MRAITWAICNGLFMAAVYFGLVEGVAGARNVAVFFAWFAFAMSLFAIIKPVAQVAFAKGPSVPHAVSVVVDFVALGIFLWHGWFVTGAVWLVHTGLMYGGFKNASKAREASE